MPISRLVNGLLLSLAAVETRFTATYGWTETSLWLTLGGNKNKLSFFLILKMASQSTLTISRICCGLAYEHESYWDWLASFRLRFPFPLLLMTWFSLNTQSMMALFCTGIALWRFDLSISESGSNQRKAYRYLET